MNRHFESKECSCKVPCEFLTEAKISFSLLSGAYIILTPMPMFATCRVKVE